MQLKIFFSIWMRCQSKGSLKSANPLLMINGVEKAALIGHVHLIKTHPVAVVGLVLDSGRIGSKLMICSV